VLIAQVREGVKACYVHADARLDIDPVTAVFMEHGRGDADRVADQFTQAVDQAMRRLNGQFRLDFGLTAAPIWVTAV
jgi:hypothetical protein